MSYILQTKQIGQQSTTITIINMGDQQGQQQQQMQMDSNIVKLRGLPWNVTPKEILQFLEGVQVDKGENGVHLITSPRDGRPNGEAFVECATDGDVAKAFEYQNKNLGKRYIESEWCWMR